MIKMYSLIGLIFIAFFLAYLVLGENREERSIEVFTEMHESKAYESFSPNPIYKNGMTLQQPVKGTVIRGMMPETFDATPEGAKLAGEELVNPFAEVDSEILERGKKEYEIFCSVCHGLSGMGDGIVTKKGYPPPPSILVEKYKGIKDGQFYHIITYGFNNMPAYAAQITREDRWKIILYIRNLQESFANE